MITLTLRLHGEDGEVLGTGQIPKHFGAYLPKTWPIDGTVYSVVGGAEGPGQQSLYLKPPA